MTTPVKNSVPSESSRSVPQELIDFTLDFLHDDVPTLRACSLVSCAFLPCSRHHIYSNVFIVHIDKLDSFRKYAGQLYQYQNLAALLEHSPHLAPLVTRFGIHGKPQWMTDVLMYPSLFPIIQSLRNLSHLEFIARSWGEFQSWARFPVDTHSFFLAALRSLSLKTLIMKGFNCLERNAHFEDVCNVAAANPALKHLSLLCYYKGVETFQPPSADSPSTERSTGTGVFVHLWRLSVPQSRLDVLYQISVQRQQYSATLSTNTPPDKLCRYSDPA